MFTQSAATLKALLYLSRANMDVPLSEAYAVMQNSLLIDLMECSRNNQSWRKDFSNSPDEDDDSVEDILQEDTESEDDDITEMEEEDDD